MANPNSAIELHDSEVKSISQSDSTVTVGFSAAYIHKYETKNGIASGTGWVQVAQLTFELAEVLGSPPEFPCVIWHGSLKANNKTYDLIPVGLEVFGNAEMELSFDKVHSVVIRGKSPKLQLLGEARFVENLPWTSIENICLGD